MLYKTASRYMVKEAAASGETLGVLGKMKSKISGAWNSTKGATKGAWNSTKGATKGAWNSTKGAAGSYKDALTRKGADHSKKIISKREMEYADVQNEIAHGSRPNTNAGRDYERVLNYKSDRINNDIENGKKALKEIKMRQAKAIGGTALAAGVVGAGAYGYNKRRR